MSVICDYDRGAYCYNIPHMFYYYYDINKLQIHFIVKSLYIAFTEPVMISMELGKLIV